MQDTELGLPRACSKFRSGEKIVESDSPATALWMGFANPDGYAEGHLGWRKAGLPMVLPVH
jgi:hypothetical protein